MNENTRITEKIRQFLFDKEVDLSDSKIYPMDLRPIILNEDNLKTDFPKGLHNLGIYCLSGKILPYSECPIELMNYIELIIINEQNKI